jgi:PPOX class probable F420-dependent enzyme
VAAFSRAEAAFLARTRVARLATADPAGQPYVIPIVFAIDDNRLFTPIDEKPKRLGPAQLRRVRNLVENPQVAVVADEYDEDWTRLAWVLVLGRAEIVDAGESHSTGIRLLREKYRQYQAMNLEDRPLIAVTPTKVTSWKFRN